MPMESTIYALVSLTTKVATWLDENLDGNQAYAMIDKPIIEKRNFPTYLSLKLVGKKKYLLVEHRYIENLVNGLISNGFKPGIDYYLSPDYK